MAKALNLTNRAARMCGRASVELYTRLYFEEHGNDIECDAVVIEVGWDTEATPPRSLP